MPVSLPPHQWDPPPLPPCFRVPRHWSGMSWRGPCSVGGVLLRRRDLPPRPLPPLSGLLLSGQVQVTKGSLSVSTLGPGSSSARPPSTTTPPTSPPPSPPKGSAPCLLLDQELWTAFWGRSLSSAATICVPHRARPVPQRPAGFPGCGGRGGEAGPVSAEPSPPA